MAPKQEWLVILPDYTGKLAERNSVRADHLKHTGPDVESGLIVLGGAMLEEPIKEGVPPKMKGSVLMCVADTEEEVVDMVVLVDTEEADMGVAGTEEEALLEAEVVTECPTSVLVSTILTGTLRT